MGSAKVLMQDFNSEVGMESSSHVALDKDKMMHLTSVTVAGTMQEVTVVGWEVDDALEMKL